MKEYTTIQISIRDKDRLDDLRQELHVHGEKSGHGIMEHDVGLIGRAVDALYREGEEGYTYQAQMKDYVRVLVGEVLDEKIDEQKPFTCPDCRRGFSSPQGLKIHRTKAKKSGRCKVI